MKIQLATILALAQLAVIQQAAHAQASFVVDPMGFGNDRHAYAVAVADIDGNGHLDVLLGENGGASVWLNDGTGALTALAWFPAGNDIVYSVAVGDVNQDGWVDVVLGTSIFVKLFLNNGGGFDNAQTWSPTIPSTTNGLGLGDVDGDGDLDIVCADGYVTTNIGRANHVYRNDGGAFPAQPTWTQTDPARVSTSVALGDVNGDGRIDVVFGNLDGSNRLYLGDAAGLLAASAAWEDTDALPTQGVALGDIDGDGIFDLVCANQTFPASMHSGNGTAFSLAASWRASASVTGRCNGVALGDVDLDGDLDVAFAKAAENNVFLNTAGVLDSVPDWRSANTWRSRGATLADLDGEGDLELVIAGDFRPREPLVREREDAGSVYQNTTSYYPATEDWRSPTRRDARDVELADVNMDGYLDLFIAHSLQPCEIYEFNGTDYGAAPVWQSEKRNGPGAYDHPPINDTAFADMDADGDPDLAIAAVSSWEHSFYRNDNGVMSDTALTAKIIGGGLVVAWGDFAGDGFPDLLLANQPYVTADFRIPNDTGVPEWRKDWEMVNRCLRTYALLVVDIDNDLDVDLVTVARQMRNTANPDGMCEFAVQLDAIWVFRNLGNGLSEISIPYETGFGNFSGGVAGYFDSDAYVDVVAIGDEIGLMINDGNNGFVRDRSWKPTTGGHTDIENSDIDGNGFSDILLTRPVAGQTYIEMFMSTDHRLAESPRFFSVAEPDVDYLAVGDIDADGDADVVTADGGDGMTRMHLSRRMPVFKGDFFVPASQQPANAAVVGDVAVAPVADNIWDVGFTLYDVESDPVRVTLEYQYEGEGAWRPMQVGSPPVTFASSPGGTRHALQWDVIEIEFTRRPIVVRLQATDVTRSVGNSAQHVSRFLLPVGEVVPLRPSIVPITPVATFPRVTVGDTICTNLVIRNTGNEPLNIDAVDLPSAEMALLSPLPMVIATGLRDTLRVCFAPTTDPVSLSDIVIHNNDPTRSGERIPVTVDVRTLRASTELFAPPGPIAIDRDVSVVTTPAPGVRVERGFLFHRAKGETAFRDSLPLDPLGNEFIAVIPAAALVETGLEYYIRIENSGVTGTDPPGAPGVFFSREVAAPTTLAAVAVPNDGQRYAQGDPVTVRALLPPGSIFQRGWVYYREGATAAYDTVAMTGSGDRAEGQIPGGVVDARGVEYRVEVETIGATLMAPPSGNPYSIRVTLVNVADPRTHAPERFRMMSFPANVQGSAQGAIVDDLGGPDKTQWRLFAYTGDSRTYVDLESIPRFEHGRGYWLISRKEYRLDSAPEVSLSTDTSAPFEVLLEPGWNLVGQPFPFPVAWNDVIRDTMAVPQPPQHYPGKLPYVNATLLEPFSGYWVHNDADSVVSIWIPPIEYTGATPTAPMAPLTWAVHVSAQDEDGSHPTLWLGVSNRAKDTRDGLDLLLPPVAPETPLDLYAVVENGRWLSQDARTATMVPGWGHAWSFDVAVAENGRVPVTLGFAFDAVPDGAEVLLLDREVKRVHTLSDGASVQVYVTGKARKASPDDTRFVLLAGDAQYIEEHRSLLPGLPTKTALHQNFPNPFNPTTVIRYELARPGRVSLQIYDVRGALVRTLVDSEKAAGRYEVGWDGVDNRGSQVASGIYFYRLVSGEGVVLTRKMVLLK